MTEETRNGEVDRRGWLVWMSLLLGALGTAMAGVPIVGYILGALVRPQRDEWITLGPLDRFPPEETTLVTFANPLRQPWDGMTAATAVYVRRQRGQNINVFAVNCTHLGCPVSWFPQSGLFMCPCHGGIYYADGALASGPPPRGLYEFPWRIRSDGQVEIYGGHLPTLQDTFDEGEASRSPAGRG
jgi:Rieske Fe-S protein